VSRRQALMLNAFKALWTDGKFLCTKENNYYHYCLAKQKCTRVFIGAKCFSFLREGERRHRVKRVRIPIHRTDCLQYCIVFVQTDDLSSTRVKNNYAGRLVDIEIKNRIINFFAVCSFEEDGKYIRVYDKFIIH